MVSIAGHQQVRRVWKDYYEAVDVVVFMVDAADVGRLGMSNFYSFYIFIHKIFIRYSDRFLVRKYISQVLSYPMPFKYVFIVNAADVGRLGMSNFLSLFFMIYP